MGQTLGDRMKEYEYAFRYSLPRRSNTIIRIDGKAFSTFTKGMEKPYDLNLMGLMDQTARYLCQNIQGCKFAFVQSDEISLLLTDYNSETTDAWFGNKIQKIVSVAASMATARFNQLLLQNYFCGIGSNSIREHFSDDFVDFEDYEISVSSIINYMPLGENRFAMFDARAFILPNADEVINYFIWRQQDATKNSISMAAQSQFSHSSLQGVNSNQLQEKLFQEAGINWNDYPEGFKRGRCIIPETQYWVRSKSAKNRGNRIDSIPNVLEDGFVYYERSDWQVVAPPVFTQNKDFVRSLF